MATVMDVGSNAGGAGAATQGGITLDVADVPLKSVVQLLVRESGINIVLAGTDKMDTPITATRAIFLWRRF